MKLEGELVFEIQKLFSLNSRKSYSIPKPTKKVFRFLVLYLFLQLLSLLDH